jgi:hypothetical protein
MAVSISGSIHELRFIALVLRLLIGCDRSPTSVEIRGARLVGAVLSLVIFFVKPGFTGCGRPK